MSASHALLKLFRKIHLYVGVFISPALLFFAFTGALQTFSLHETTQGRDYKPPTWAVTLGQIHKKQTDIVPVRRPRLEGPKAANGSPDGSAKAPKAPDAAPAPAPKSHLPLKIFFLLVAVGLFILTITGIYMSYKYTRKPVVVTSLLLLGIVIPIFLLRF